MLANMIRLVVFLSLFATLTVCLIASPAAQTKEITYGATGMAKGGAGAIASSTTLAAGVTHRMGISFETAPLAADTEVTGPINLVLWVSSTTEDMDIFATIRNIDAQGKDAHSVLLEPMIDARVLGGVRGGEH